MEGLIGEVADDDPVHPRADSMRVLTALPDGTLTLRHRYETWVDYASRPLPARVDLAPLLPVLQEMERVVPSNSLVDLIVGSVIGYSVYIGAPVQKHPHVMAWLQKVQARPAMQIDA